MEEDHRANTAHHVRIEYMDAAFQRHEKTIEATEEEIRRLQQKILDVRAKMEALTIDKEKVKAAMEEEQKQEEAAKQKTQAEKKKEEDRYAFNRLFAPAPPSGAPPPAPAATTAPVAATAATAPAAAPAPVAAAAPSELADMVSLMGQLMAKFTAQEVTLQNMAASQGKLENVVEQTVDQTRNLQARLAEISASTESKAATPQRGARKKKHRDGVEIRAGSDSDVVAMEQDGGKAVVDLREEEEKREQEDFAKAAGERR